ncbi:putative bifunctional diguanylate cyclase/phosphodiesterase [Klenkia brasiliensis]|uniref:Diguanylate cyclase (GGDEF) domain-containing protein n=1 Tax=Klenkia brasiliensis TaxID=333142 RepID=A0A1G7XWW1_9ACTN|nr:EAL domain-containing protein [Klenkia brasiliensis]SDG88678.1 diguanylate cyclase (GGDEF) domain-containing protein [Klenkia brasiliensis]
MTSRSVRTGLPLWAHLAALVLVPLLGVGAFAAFLVVRAGGDADAAAEADRSVRSAAALATAAGAVDREVLPMLTVAALQNPGAAQSLGVPAAFAEAALSAARSGLADARSATDDAVTAAGRHGATAAVDAATTTIARLRADVDAPGQDLGSLADAYYGMGEAADALAAASRSEMAGASTADIPGATTAAVADVDLVARYVQASSRQLPQFLGWTFAATSDLDTGASWTQAQQDYTSAVLGLGGLRSSELAQDWRDLQATPAAQTLQGTIGAAGPEPVELPLLTISGLVTAGTERSADADALLASAVGTAVDAAAADRAAADAERTTTLLAAFLVTLVAVTVAWWFGRSVTRSLAAVAGQAAQISRGSLVAVPVTGPREVRTVSGALDDAVGSLRRIQDQAAAVARGELDSPTLSESLPGPLGEVVHDSVQQLVRSVQLRDRLQSELAHQAAHDPLTDLPNRAQALQLVDAALARGQRSGSMVGVLFVDLDGFKAVNDRAGHAAGDAVLRTVAGRLATGVRAGDTVCRLGGDEFVALIEPVDDVRALVALAERLVAAVAEDVLVPHASGGQVAVHVGASIGVAISQDGQLVGETLIAQADAATYLAKARGKGRVELFDDELRSRMAARHELDAHLRDALEHGGLRLVYQPVVEVVSGEVTGWEALLRWEHEGRSVPPSEFIPVAEDSDLVCDLDAWVLRRATAQLASWRTARGESDGGPTMAVNLSGRHLADPRVVDHVRDALTAAGLPAQLLVLEVTETVLVDSPAALDHLARLRALGVGIAIDDFGTGYTSIGQLGAMPVDTLKIDRSFVASEDPAQRSLVTLMIQTAHILGLGVVAEGVERVSQLEDLRDDRCDQAQGYLMDRPLEPAEAFARYGAVIAPGVLS